MSNSIVPGASGVGFGFNILGPYSMSSATSQIFKSTDKVGGQWTYNPSGITYDVPANVVVNDVTNDHGDAYVFQKKDDFSKHFAASASIGVSAGAFSGEWDMAYSSALEQGSSYYFCMYEALFDGWSVTLGSEDKSQLDPAFVQELQALPNVFSPNNPRQFYDFLSKWGTHYISSVIVGGSFRYFMAVNTAYSSDSTEIETSVKLEYKAVFVDTTAQASTDWSTLTTNWSQSRSVTIAAQGGDTGSLSALAPDYGENDSSAFSSWQKAVITNPAITGFTLRPLWSLAPAKNQDSIRAAIDAYSGDVISLFNIYQAGSDSTSPTASFGLTVAGVTVNPDPNPDPPAPIRVTRGGIAFIEPASSFFVTLIDRNSHRVLFSKVYYFSRYSGNEEEGELPIPLPNDSGKTYQSLWNDLQPALAGQSDYIATFIATGLYLQDEYPTIEVENWLTSCGATLAQWRNLLQNSGYDDALSYLFIGFSDARGFVAESVSFVPGIEAFNPILDRPLRSFLSTPAQAGDLDT